MHRISDKSRISTLADIEGSIRGNILEVADGVTIDSFVKIKFAGGNGNVYIGKHTTINSGVVIYSGNGVKIGENVAIAANCTLAPVNHEYKSAYKKIIDQGFSVSKGGIVIEDDVWIGANCVILDGAILRKGCVVGASSLVRGELESNGVFAGNPIRKIGRRA